jgi:hypothetical protein
LEKHEHLEFAPQLPWPLHLFGHDAEATPMIAASAYFDKTFIVERWWWWRRREEFDDSGFVFYSLPR